MKINASTVRAKTSIKTKTLAFSAYLLLATVCQAATLSLYTTPRDVTTVNTHNVLLVEGQSGGVRVIAEGAVFPSSAGEPEIPWQLVTVLLPPNANIDNLAVHLENTKYKTLDGVWAIEPTPPVSTRDKNDNPVEIWPQGKTFKDGRDAAVYGADAFWPAEPALRTHTGQLDRWQIAEVAVPLVQYNPVTGQLKELLSADIVVDAPRRGRGVIDPHSRGRGAISARRGRDRVRNMVKNFTTAAVEYDAASDAAITSNSTTEIKSAAADDGLISAAGINSKGYLILTTSAIVNSSTTLADFVAHKQSRGWTVMVKTESQWGGGSGPTAAVNIRNWLRANYVSLDILYVLLIGNPNPDTGDVPMRWYDDGFDGGAPTDALYSDLTTADGWDKYWEVLVGRIPYYGSTTELDAILQKTINYETSTEVQWRWNTLLPMVPLDTNTPSYHCGEQIRSQFLIPNNITSTRIYEDNYGLSPAPEYLLSGRYPATQWGSQPYGLVAWTTHGNQTLAAGVIDTGNIWRLNDTYPSAVYQGSCQNAWPEISGNLAYSILKRGGITTVAATRNSYYNPGQTEYSIWGSIGSLAYRYSKYLAVDRQSCGLAISNAKQEGTIITANAARMTLYGDPSIVVFVDSDFTPPTPNPMTWKVVPYESGTGAITMTAATATDNGGGDVEYYFQCVSGDGSDSGWQTDSTFTLSGLAPANYSYRVKARDLSDRRNETGYSAEALVTIPPYPYNGQVRAIPGTIQAEHFDVGGQGITYFDTTPGNSGSQLRLLEDVDIAAITDGAAGNAIDAIDTGEWLLYTVSSTAAQTDLYVRVASTQAGGQILVWLEESLLAAVDVPVTGSLTAWQNVVIPDLTLPDIENAALKLEFVGTGYRLNWIAFQTQMPYLGAPAAIPGRIEFENYDLGGWQISYYDTTPENNSYGLYRTDGVEVKDVDGGFAVVAATGEWLEYTCNIEPGTYTILIRHASVSAAQQLAMSLGAETLATFTLPKTNGSNNWKNTSISDIGLTGGQQVLRFTMTTSTGRIDYVEFFRQYNPADASQNGRVDMEDFAMLAAQWQASDADLQNLLMLTQNWLVVE